MYNQDINSNLIDSYIIVWNNIQVRVNMWFLLHAIVLNLSLWSGNNSITYNVWIKSIRWKWCFSLINPSHSLDCVMWTEKLKRFQGKGERCSTDIGIIYSTVSEPGGMGKHQSNSTIPPWPNLTLNGNHHESSLHAMRFSLSIIQMYFQLDLITFCRSSTLTNWLKLFAAGYSSWVRLQSTRADRLIRPWLISLFHSWPMRFLWNIIFQIFSSEPSTTVGTGAN